MEMLIHYLTREREADDFFQADKHTTDRGIILVVIMRKIVEL